MITCLTYGGYFLYEAKQNPYKLYSYSFSWWISSLTGKVMGITIPVRFRETLYGKFASMYNVNLEECKNQDLKSYNSFKDFFTREINLATRPIEDSSPVSIASPCDGKVYSYGEVKDGTMLAVKGWEYSVDEFCYGEAELEKQ